MPLSDSQCIQFARFAEAALGVRDEAAFRALVRDHVCPLLPHGPLFAGTGRLCFDHMEILHVIGVNDPDAHLSAIPRLFHVRERPAFGCWLKQRSAIVLDQQSATPMSEREKLEVELVGQGRLAIHGVADLSGNMGSFFSFAQVPLGLPVTEVETILNLICPTLHAALSRIPSSAPANAVLASLTKIEKQLLISLAAGRSNAEIAHLRSKSPETVRNQLRKLFAKLNVSSRAEAVSLLHTTKTIQGIDLE